MRILGFFFGLLFISHSVLFAQGDPFAQLGHRPWSLERFKEHTLAHKERVQWLMVFTNQLFPEPLPEEMVQARGRLHDEAKVSTDLFVLPPFLGRAPESFIALAYLHQIVGIDLRRLPEDSVARARALAIIAEVNRRDARNEAEFLKDWNLLDTEGRPTPEGQQLKRIEVIADLVDRGLDPDARLEFNRSPMKLGSEILQDPQDKHLARIVEAHYFEIFGEAKAPQLSMTLAKLCRRGIEAIQMARTRAQFQLRLSPLH